MPIFVNVIYLDFQTPYNILCCNIYLTYFPYWLENAKNRNMNISLTLLIKCLLINDIRLLLGMTLLTVQRKSENYHQPKIPCFHQRGVSYKSHNAKCPTLDWWTYSSNVLHTRIEIINKEMKLKISLSILLENKISPVILMPRIKSFVILFPTH